MNNRNVRLFITQLGQAKLCVRRGSYVISDEQLKSRLSEIDRLLTRIIAEIINCLVSLSKEPK